jgi:hypothetical protein
MYTSWLNQAHACAYYVDGFGHTVNMSSGFKADSERSMWYFLLKAAEAGEI